MAVKRLVDDLHRCYSKAKLKSAEMAERKIIEIAHNGGPAMTYYSCTLCGGYHLTKQQGNNGRIV